MNFVDTLIQMTKENDNIALWIKYFNNEQNFNLAIACNFDNDLAQLVQKELIKECPKQLGL